MREKGGRSSRGNTPEALRGMHTEAPEAGVPHVRNDMRDADLRLVLMDIYHRMYARFGDRHWWPAKTAEEVVIGAILVQSVAWSNVVKAIGQLRERGLLSLPAIHAASAETIEACVVPTRYYRVKAKKLKAFAAHVCERYGGDLERMFDQDAASLRSELLSIYGIGPETADDIVLYAAGKPSFVIDAYTKRIFARLGLVDEHVGYEPLRQWFMRHLPEDVALYNNYHALIDAIGHHYCAARRPQCRVCPLAPVCRHAATMPDESGAEETPPAPHRFHQ
ncbi:endonuclease [Alicyclobacillus sp.]|uniref:endonuclease III domain-containing protein n=1 Tax=Alicyclobacillus sp. TaxID=61169 RepID=UPI0025C1AB48|nr:endonuclease [Alicyclobacillus sp.]MCL6515815.1 endonuclease [Alicyclobacillus sp.]